MNKTSVQRLEDDLTIPKLSYNFTKISDIKNRTQNSFIDTIGIVVDIQEERETKNKFGTNSSERTVVSNAYIYDETKTSIMVSFWNEIVS